MNLHLIAVGLSKKDGCCENCQVQKIAALEWLYCKFNFEHFDKTLITPWAYMAP